MKTRIITVDTISTKGRNPTNSKHYLTAHLKANEAEKRRNYKTYEQLKKIVQRMVPTQLLGKNELNGTIKVARYVDLKNGMRLKLTSAQKDDIAKIHERVELAERLKLEMNKSSTNRKG